MPFVRLVSSSVRRLYPRCGEISDKTIGAPRCHHKQNACHQFMFVLAYSVQPMYFSRGGRCYFPCPICAPILSSLPAETARDSLPTPVQMLKLPRSVWRGTCQGAGQTFPYLHLAHFQKC